MKRIKELKNKNKLYERVIDEILEDSKDYEGTIKERIIQRCNDIVELGCVSGTVSSLIYYTDTISFYNNYYEEITEIVEELEESGMNILECCLKNNLTTTQIIMNDEQAKTQISWLIYEEIAHELLNILEEE